MSQQQVAIAALTCGACGSVSPIEEGDASNVMAVLWQWLDEHECHAATEDDPTSP